MARGRVGVTQCVLEGLKEGELVLGGLMMGC